jgi:hypothetical protein
MKMASIVVAALFFFITAGIVFSANLEDQDTLNILAKDKTLLVTSVPSNLDVYIIPQEDAIGSFGIFHYTDKQYHVGKTPLQIKLKPGKFNVTVVYKAVQFYKDSEDRQLFGLQEGNPIPFAKIYNIEQVANHAGLITALFWLKDQSLAEFSALMPKKNSFPMIQRKTYAEEFEKANIPSQDQSYLVEMISRVGKCVWYSKGQAKWLVISIDELRPKITGSDHYLGEWNF